MTTTPVAALTPLEPLSPADISLRIARAYGFAQSLAAVLVNTLPVDAPDPNPDTVKAAGKIGASPALREFPDRTVDSYA